MHMYMCMYMYMCIYIYVCVCVCARKACFLCLASSSGESGEDTLELVLA